MTTKTILSWLFRLIAAGILLQTLYFKFSAHPESIYIFSQLGMEPWGRIGTGIAELIIGILLLIPRTAWIGAIGGLGVISGAFVAHFTKLGIEVQGDGGLLFGLAITVFVCCVFILWLHREEVLKAVKRRKAKTIWVFLIFTGFIQGCNQEENTPSSRAEYEVTITGNWHVGNFFDQFPDGDHFSPVIGMVHNERASLILNIM